MATSPNSESSNRKAAKSAVSVMAGRLIPVLWDIPDEPRDDQLEASGGCLSAKPKRKHHARTADVKRAIKAVRSVGLNAARVEFEPDGRFAIVASLDKSASNDDLDSWIAKHARSTQGNK